MSQRGGSWKSKGRGRPSPYGRGGNGGGYHKRNRGGGEAGRTALGNTVESAPSEERMVAVPQAPGPVKSEAVSDVGGASPSLTQTDTPPRPGEKKYSVKARLFVGNLPRDYTHDVVKEMFQQFGEVKEVFVQREKSFGFVRMVSVCGGGVHMIWELLGMGAVSTCVRYGSCIHMC